MKTIVAHTDGSCRKNPGPGGWGAMLRKGTKHKMLKGADPQTTNNRMEMMGVIEVLRFLEGKGPYNLRIVSDSQYVIKGISQWVPGWRRRNWKTSGGGPVKNSDLWKEIDSLRGFHNIEWCWVRGHVGHEDNEIADRLANDVAVEAGYYELRCSSHYDFIDTHLAKFWTEAGAGGKMTNSDANGMSASHGDKGYQYKDQWGEKGIHFYHGMLLYMLTFSNVMDRPKHESAEWVEDNYLRFRSVLPQL